MIVLVTFSTFPESTFINKEPKYLAPLFGASTLPVHEPTKLDDSNYWSLYSFGAINSSNGELIEKNNMEDRKWKRNYDS